MEWTKGIIPDFQVSKVQENFDNAKRNTSADNSVVNLPKRTRTAPSSNKYFAKVAKGKRSLGIVDPSDPDGKTPRSG